MSGMWDRFISILGRDSKGRIASERSSVRLQLEQLEKREVLNATTTASDQQAAAAVYRAAADNYEFVVSTLSAEIGQALPIVTDVLNNLSAQYQQFVVQVVDTFFPGLENATQAALNASQTVSSAGTQNTLFNTNSQAINYFPFNP
jgi:hypothetical protein